MESALRRASWSAVSKAGADVGVVLMGLQRYGTHRRAGYVAHPYIRRMQRPRMFRLEGRLSRPLRSGCVKGLLWAIVAAAMFAATGEAQLLTFRFRALDPIPVSAGDDAGPQAATLADVNDDMRLDLIVVSPDDDQVAVLLGRGNGTFDPPRMYEVESSPTAVAVADFGSPFGSSDAGDSDGKVDLIVANDDGFAEILLGRGDGDFDPPEQDLSEILDDAFELLGIVIGDFDRNGRNDLALLDYFEDVFLLCNESGSLASCPSGLIETGGEGAFAIAGGDFDGDAFLDLAVLNRDSRDLSPIFGNGAGSFAEVAETIPTSATGGQEPRTFGVVRLDGDARADLVVGNCDVFSDDGLLGLYGQGNRSFSRRTFTAPFALTGLALADLDGDTHLDVAMVVDEPGSAGFISVSRGDGTGGFGDLPFTPHGSPTISGRAVLTGDLNGDQRVDVVVLNADGRAIHVALNLPADRCAGDCDGNRTVSITELVLAVDIALGSQPVGACTAVDTDGSRTVEINELIAAALHDLMGCPP